MGKKRDLAKEEDEFIAAVVQGQKEKRNNLKNSSNYSSKNSLNSDSSNRKNFMDLFKDFSNNDENESKSGLELCDYHFNKCINSNQETLSSKGHYELNNSNKPERVYGRSKDSQGRGETVSTVSFKKTGEFSGILSYKQDVIKYDTNASKDKIVSMADKRKACELYHSHDGIKSKIVYIDGKFSLAKHEEFSHGPNEKVDRNMRDNKSTCKTNYVDVSGLKDDSYTRFRTPQLDNDKKSDSSICREGRNFLSEQRKKQQERESYKNNHSELFSHDHAKDMFQQFKDGKTEQVREAEERRYQEEMRERERELERQREADRLRDEELERERKLEEERRCKEEREQENENRKCSCSWWYHDRCLKHHDDDYCYKCSDHDTSEHSCATCSSFDSCPGHTKNGDSWYGICTAYNGNPIRDNPSSHTCKAWN